jgi:uncharacterized RDD family membrane protein YckC
MSRASGKPPRAPTPARRFDAHETERLRALEGVPLASFRARALAFLIDFFLSGIVFLAVAVPIGALASRLGWLHGDVKLEFDFEHWYALPFLVAYFGLLAWSGNGRTPGKRVTGIRAVSLVTERITLWQATERALGYGASFLELGFGFVQYFIDPNRQTVHDRIAHTIVVTERGSRGHAG